MLIAALVVAVVGLLAAEARQHASRGWWKTAASISFVAIGATGYGSFTWSAWIMAGLVLSAVGDVALIGRSKVWFLSGLGAFLFAHLAYVGGFVAAGPSWPAAVLVAIPLAVAFAVVARWLLPHTGSLRIPVVAYMSAISLMVALAAGVAIAGAPPATFPAAALFYVSDLAVARDRFVAPGVVNRLWGLPVYYLAQLLFASLV